MVAALAVPLHLVRLAVGKSVVSGDDADAAPTAVEVRGAERATQLQPELRPVADVHRLEDVDGAPHSIDESEDLWTSAPHAVLAHRCTVAFRSHVVLLCSCRDKLGNGDHLVALEMQRAVDVGSKRVDGQIAQRSDALPERGVVHVEVLGLILEGDAQSDRVEEAVARALHLLDAECRVLLWPARLGLELAQHLRIEATP
mmetsp:Transcript_21347/g.45817  ORF Transcript_21347/g.45817 Transcript_21347/m.45817 type:complete len:200 (-) Transcript_21347:198-797(-)